jgi:LacI family transcriptional regulator
MRQQKRIGVMMDLDQPYKWHVSSFAGIHKYAREHPDWKLVVDEWADFSLPANRRSRSPYDGIIGRMSVLGASRAKRLDVPAVNLWLSSPAKGLHGVFPDYSKSGDLVADHLVSRGFRYLAAVTTPNDVASFRQAAAMERWAKRGDCDGWLGNLSLAQPTGPEEWRDVVKMLDRWMDDWTLPVGLLIREPGFARLIIEMVTDRGWIVPQQVAIVSSINQETSCEHPEPGLTAVEMPYEECGYEAAKLLDRLIDSKRQRGRPFRDPEAILLAPIGIVTRHSTDFFAVNDSLVQRAMRYIAANLDKRLSPVRIAKQMKVSRRTLDMHFLDALGVTVSAEISRLRIERVKRELAAPGDHTVVAIAAQTGFASTRTLNDLFLKTVGMTPLEYRNVHRPPA